MVVAPLFLALGGALSVGSFIGHRRNNTLATGTLDALREKFAPRTVRYSRIGRGIGLGFEFDLDGAIPSMRGLMTMLPRYAIMYMPIAHVLGRCDLLKLSIPAADLAPGVGSIVGEGFGRMGRRPQWYVLENDQDLRESQVVVDGRTFRVYGYNPSVIERLTALAPRLRGVRGFNQLSVDSRSGELTIFLTPRLDTVASDVSFAHEIIYFLTAA